MIVMIDVNTITKELLLPEVATVSSTNTPFANKPATFVFDVFIEVDFSKI